MCPFKGTEGTKDTLEALEKGLKSERQAAQSRLARNTGCRRCSVGVHARPRLKFNWCAQVGRHSHGLTTLADGQRLACSKVGNTHAKQTSAPDQAQLAKIKCD